MFFQTKSPLGSFFFEYYPKEKIKIFFHPKFSLFFLFQDCFTKILNFHAVEIFQNRVNQKRKFIKNKQKCQEPLNHAYDLLK